MASPSISGVPLGQRIIRANLNAVPLMGVPHWRELRIATEPDRHVLIAMHLPDGDWRRVQKAEGYRFVIVNGQITFEDNVCTHALPGKLLRSYDQAPT